MYLISQNKGGLTTASSGRARRASIIGGAKPIICVPAAEAGHVSPKIV